MASANGCRWSPKGTEPAGRLAARSRAAYTRPARARRVQRFAVNVNPRESDLARFDPELLPSQLRREPAADQSDQPLAVARFVVLFPLFLVGRAGLLLVEPVLAWQFGRGRG